MDSAPCIVTLWHASGVDVPAALLSALSGAKGAAGGVKVRVVGDPFLALAELCRVVREERKKAAAGVVEATAARLVIVYPELLTDAGDLCVAADTYAPGVPRWQFGPATNPTLRPIVESDVAKWGARNLPVVVVPEAVERVKTSRTPGVPQLRLAGEGPVGGLGAGTSGGASGGVIGSGEALDNSSNPVDAERLAGGPAPTTPRSAPLITDEELRMLLGEHNDESR